MAGKPERVELRLEEDTLQSIDLWREKQGDIPPSRSEAIRRLVELGLRQNQMSDGDRLIIMMLRDLYKATKTKSDLDPEFIANVLYGGHYWALDWKYSGLFHNHVDSRAEVHAVTDILDMWNFIEEAFDQLSTADQERLKNDAEPLGEHVRFTGFDGNNEGERYGIASFLVNDLERFTRFKGRDLNAHMPTTDMYARMFQVFEPIRRDLIGRSLGVGELTAILKTQMHPSRRK